MQPDSGSRPATDALPRHSRGLSTQPAVVLAADDQVPAGDDWLSAGERAVLARLLVPARRREWRLGRWVAKRAVAAVLQSDGIEVVAAEDGAPEALVNGQAALVTISISHRAGLAACVVGGPGMAVGCDVELVEPHPEALTRRFFTSSERAMLDRLGNVSRDVAVALVWSAKESTVKALRLGLRLEVREIEVELDADAGRSGWRALRVRYGCQTFGGWWRLVGRHVLTVVAEPSAAPPALVTAQ